MKTELKVKFRLTFKSREEGDHLVYEKYEVNFRRHFYLTVRKPLTLITLNSIQLLVY